MTRAGHRQPRAVQQESRDAEQPSITMTTWYASCDLRLAAAGLAAVTVAKMLRGDEGSG
jgi:hypothetical protein